MANVFLSLPVPAVDGVGAAVNCLVMGSLRSIVAGVTPGPSGEGMRCTLNIEIADSAVAPVSDDQWNPIATFSADFGDDITVSIAAKWMRVRRANSRFPAGVPSVSVGSTDDGTMIANLPVTAADGTGAGVDTSALGPWKTVCVGGTYRGNVNVEISEDGVFYSNQYSFLNPNAQSGAFMSKFMRVVRDGVPTINPGLPVVNVGACAMPGGGGGGGAGGLQFFVVAGVVGQSLYPVVLPAARADASYEVLSQVNAPSPNMIKGITVDPTTITAVGFTAELTAGAEAGDLLIFFVHDV